MGRDEGACGGPYQAVTRAGARLSGGRERGKLPVGPPYGASSPQLTMARWQLSSSRLGPVPSSPESFSGEPLQSQRLRRSMPASATLRSGPPAMSDLRYSGWTHPFWSVHRCERGSVSATRAGIADTAGLAEDYYYCSYSATDPVFSGSLISELPIPPTLQPPLSVPLPVGEPGSLPPQPSAMTAIPQPPV